MYIYSMLSLDITYTMERLCIICTIYIVYLEAQVKHCIQQVFFLIFGRGVSPLRLQYSTFMVLPVSGRIHLAVEI